MTLIINLTMKRIILLCMALTVLSACAPEGAKSVLIQSRDKCQSILGGHYVMEHREKTMSRNDTAVCRYTCDFKKLPNDTAYGMAFALFEEGADWSNHYLYTGNEFVWFTDTVGEIMSCDRWMNEIVAQRHNRTFYTAFTSPNCYPLPDDKALADSTYTYTLTEVKLDDKPCYFVRILQKMDEDVGNTSGLRCIRYEVELWIDKNDYLPMQYTIAYDLVEGQDTMCQYDLFKLIAFDTACDESRMSLESIPPKVRLEEYVPYQELEPLASGTPAPDWTLPSLTGDKVRLASFKGKVVLIDFFYKSCRPCCSALPVLQRLHEKYRDRGFVMIGIDPYDDPEKDAMADFLSKRGISYTVLFSDHDLAEKYRVGAYPTLFFLDRKGRIVKIEEGFSPEQEDAIEEQLVKLL